MIRQPVTISRPAFRLQSRSLWLCAGMLAIGCYYTLLLANLHPAPLGPEKLDHVFGSMLHHLLAGRFDIDAAAIGNEAFTRNGLTLSYFGIFPALLRLPLLPFIDVQTSGLARLSCLSAMLVYVFFQLRTLLCAHDAMAPAQRSNGLLAVMAASLTLSGPQLYLLSSGWVFHEPVFWSAAFGAIFNFILLRRLANGVALRRGDMTWLALLAGLALNTRVSVGAGLCIATALLFLRQIITGTTLVTPMGAPCDIPGGWRVMRARAVNLWLPVLMLAIAGLLVAVVNIERWGNPFTFADFRYYDLAHRMPRRLQVIQLHGEISILRMPTGILYYLTGLPAMLKDSPAFVGYFSAYFDGIEQPPNSGLLTDPLTVLLAALGIRRLWRERPFGTADFALVLAGQAVTMVLVCCAMYMALRYRMDFAPFFTLAMFIGYPAASALVAGNRRLLLPPVALCISGIVGSHYTLMLYKYWAGGLTEHARAALAPFVPFAANSWNF